MNFHQNGQKNLSSNQLKIFLNAYDHILGLFNSKFYRSDAHVKSKTKTFHQNGQKSLFLSATEYFPSRTIIQPG